MHRSFSSIILPAALGLALPLAAQQASAPDRADLLGDLLDGALTWREVGPFRGGRSCAVAGIPQDRDTYYFGACGGGVWKTADGGRSWSNVSDGFFGGSVGAVAVSEWDPNVIWVGTGEKTVRGNVSHGDGMWRSTDAGRSWQQVGLDDSRHICRVRVHPRDPDTAWAAVLGHLHGPNDERGVFRTRDGGQTWERVLFVSADAGAVDLCLDPTNPRILYASTWNVRRQPWELASGGPGSGLWKSTDGGDNWTELTGKDGLPDGTWGISGVSVSPVDPDVVYAIIENEKGGLFRSSDAGETWKRVNSEQKLRQRAWYYSRVFCGPDDVDEVYVANVGFWRSRDGGESFSRIGTPHGDNHDLWIDPGDPARMIESNDGGANVSTDGGRTWTAQDTQPTAQMYRVSLDDAFPFHLLGGQQDNSTVRIRSRNVDGGSIGERDWAPSAGGESGHVVAQPGNPDLVFGGSYGGYLTWVDHGSRQRRSVHVWPDSVMGHGAIDARYRFQWNFPIFFSPHDPGVIYCAAQRLFESSDLGQSWRAISPDLTRNDPSKLGPSGGPITKDNTGVEYYCTIFAACESPVQPGVFWCGSDDGLVHCSRDGGASWEGGPIPGLGEWARINCIDPHPTLPGTAYVAATRYQLDDFAPYLFVTEDYGATWRRLAADGIAGDHFTRAIRVDHQRPEILYVGTERGVYVSLDAGARWHPLDSGELPIVPVTDLAVRGRELVAATQGRGYWILNDLEVLRDQRGLDAGFVVVQPEPAYRLPMRGGRKPQNAGTNPPGGVVFRYRLTAEQAELKGEERLRITIRDVEDEIVRELLPKGGGKDDDDPRLLRGLPTDAGWNLYAWDMDWPGARDFPGMVLWNGSLGGPVAVPGRYTAEVSVGDVRQLLQFEILPDPRASASAEDYAAQLAFRRGVVQKLDTTHMAIRELRETRAELEGLRDVLGDDDQAKALAERITQTVDQLTAAEEALYQTKSESRQDPLNFPIRLNDKLAALNRSSGGFGPTSQELQVFQELSGRIDAQLAIIQSVLGTDVSAIDQGARELAVPRVGGGR